MDKLGSAISFYENHQLVIVFNPLSFDLVRDITLIQCKIIKELGNSVSIGISKLRNDQQSVYEAYRETFKILKNKFYLGRGLIIYEGAREAFSTNDSMEVLQREKLFNALASGNYQKTEDMINEFCKRVRTKKISYERLQILHLRLMEVFCEALEKSNIRQEVLFSTELDVGKRMDDFETLEDLQTWLLMIFGKGVNLINGKGQGHIRKIADDALRYIQEHLQEDISLDGMAKKLYVNPAYLSRLFKDEVGITFTHYLMKARIEKAKDLLKKTYLKVYEVSEMVGYSNWKYFCRIFKDFEGVTPNEYRDRIPAINKEVENLKK